MILLEQPGGMAVNPHGGPLGPVEHCKGMAAAGFGWVVFNAFDGETKPSDWQVWQREAMRARLRFGWWARCYNLSDLEFLAGLAQADMSPVVVFNCEDELADGTVTVNQILRCAVPLLAQGCAVGLSTVAPVYGDVDWEKVTNAGVVVMPQAFMNVEPTLTAMGAHDQAVKAGASLVNVSLGLYKTPRCPDGLTVEDYEPLPAAWSVYRVDSIGRWP